LEIYGFKSFAKKLDLRLLGGITAIVGPNGCGKTNVVDAIRWVFGEQRPTQIRLEHMEDVLFKGSASRRQLGMSEVSLTIENDSDILPVNLPEVTITRRLFRSGESEYMINRKMCRLGDINNMFMDTGAGRDSYSVFEPEVINSILSDKTENRRHIFEEAAGITKYKSRRKSALNTLISIEDDLKHLDDFISELERRADSLKRQASKASRYRKLKSEFKSRTITLGTYEIEKLKKKISAISSKLVSVQSLMETEKAKSSTVADEIEHLSVEMLTMEKELVKITDRYEANVRTVSEKENEMARFESRIESLGEMADRTKETAQRNSAALEKLAESHGKCAEELTNVENYLKKIDSNSSIKIEKVKEFEKELVERTNAYNSLQQEYRRIEREITTFKSSLAHLKTRREEGENKLRKILARVNEVGVSLSGIDKEISMFQDKKLQSTRNRNELSVKLTTNKEKLSSRMQELKILDYKLLQVRGKQVSLKAEIDFLTEVIKSFKGYFDGVRNAVNSKELQGRVLGVLADIVSTDDKYILAIETALMNNLQNIVVDSPEAALTGVRYLSKEKRGRAVFLPLNAKLDSNFQYSIPREAGVIGPAYEFIRTDNRFVPVLRRLLDCIIIVDSLDTALKLHNRFDDFNFVTLSGEMVGRCGDIYGGCMEDYAEKSSLGRLEKLENLKVALSEAEREIDRYEKKRTVHINDCDSLRSLIGECEKEIETVSMKLTQISSNEARAEAKREAAVDMMNNLNEESLRIKISFKDFDVESRNLENQLGKSNEVFSSVKKILSKTSLEIKDLKAEFDSILSEMNTCEIERAGLREKKVALTHEIEVISERRESLAHSSKRTLQEIEDAETESLQVGVKKKNIMEELDILEKEHGQLEKRKVELRKCYAEMKSMRNDKERNLQKLREELVELSKKESSITLEKDEASMIMRNIIQKLSEEYFISAEEIPPADYNPDFEPENEKLLLVDLRKKIHNIGDVNLAAEADYDEEKKRLDFLKKERKDLIEARDALIETISKINNIAKARFLHTFEQIRVNFKSTFRDFFYGGICDLELAENEDPLEANIIITARPPGKNIRSINLLSSGERALTAISLLFGIYMVKPSPFCILDEVDAPLDDANIDRFLHVIKEFSKNTQFIMVTHNKKTMAQADNLYGITMEEPGLSSLVSVRLSEVDAYINENRTAQNEQSSSETVNI